MIDIHIDRFRELKLELENTSDEFNKKKIVLEMKKVANKVPFLRGWPSSKVFWDEEASIWRIRIDTESSLVIDKIVRSYISSNNLDLGSGCFGYGVGLDLSFEMIRYSEVRDRVVSDLRDGLPFKDSSFDSVSLIFVLNYVSDIDGLLLEIKRILKPGGRLLAIQALRPFKSIHSIVEKNSLEVISSKLGKYTRVKGLAVFKA